MPGRRTLLLTRPLAQSREFAAAVEAALPGRFDCLIAPVMRIAPTEAPIDLTGAQGLLFTSANGVEHFAARTTDRRLPAFCVGAMTAEAARRIGLVAEAAGGDVAALARLAIAACRPGASDFVHIRGRHAAGDLLGLLRAAGVPARAAELYDQLPCPLTAEARGLLGAGGVDVIALFSPRSAALLSAEIRAGGWSLATTTLLALSAAAAAGFGGPEPRVRMLAATPTRAGMIAALATF